MRSRTQKRREAHKEINQLKNSPPKQGPQGAKERTFKKYWWYAEQLALLEAINGFEVFYKQTCIQLGEVLKELIPIERIKGEIDANVLWSLKDFPGAASLLFEKQLFHKLETIDNATKMFFGDGKARYNSPNGLLKERIRCLRAAFQIRHTLSHNSAVVTLSDGAKFATQGFNAETGEVIDPTKDHFSTAVLQFMQLEAKEFTDWLRQETIKFLDDAVKNRALSVAFAKRAVLKQMLGGTDLEWNAITWT